LIDEWTRVEAKYYNIRDGKKIKLLGISPIVDTLVIFFVIWKVIIYLPIVIKENFYKVLSNLNFRINCAWVIMLVLGYYLPLKIYWG
jgi:hypothetical protein